MIFVQLLPDVHSIKANNFAFRVLYGGLVASQKCSQPKFANNFLTPCTWNPIHLGADSTPSKLWASTLQKFG